MEFTDPALRFSRAPDQLSCELDGEIATLNLGLQRYFGFAEVAATIWRELESPKSFETLAHAVLAEYDVQDDECRRDLSGFLGTLQDRGLLKVEAAAG